MLNHHISTGKLNNQITQNIMTNNYIKPELEMISVYSEGTVLTVSGVKAGGEDITWGQTI